MKDRYPQKIFCIGLNKTGTTSMKKVFMDFGYVVGDQAQAEIITLRLLKNNKYSSLLNYCKTAEFFQDIPFGLHGVYKVLDEKFSSAKFILTIRDDDNEWFASLTEFHKKRLSKDGKSVRVRDFKNSNYRYRGFEFDIAKFLWLKNRRYSNDDFIYSERASKNYYNTQNKQAVSYFKGRNNFIVINLKDKHSYLKLCKFLGNKPLYDNFPHENKSR